MNIEILSNFWKQFLFISEQIFSAYSQDDQKANASLDENKMKDRVMQTEKE